MPGVPIIFLFVNERNSTSARALAVSSEGKLLAEAIDESPANALMKLSRNRRPYDEAYGSDYALQLVPLHTDPKTYPPLADAVVRMMANPPAAMKKRVEEEDDGTTWSGGSGDEEEGFSGDFDADRAADTRDDAEL